MKKKHKKTTKARGEMKFSLYQLNQSIISQLPPYTEAQKKELADKITKWDLEVNPCVKYYMLLNNDRRYYTVLHYDDNSHTEFDSLGDGVVILLQEQGYDIVSDEILDDHCEIWIKDKDETVVYLLFPYDKGVVSYG